MLQSPMCSDLFCLIQQSFLYLLHLAHLVQFLGTFTYLFFCLYPMFSARLYVSQSQETNSKACLLLQCSQQYLHLIMYLNTLFSLITREMMGSVDVYSISFGKTNRINDFFPEITPIKHCSLSCIKIFNSNLRAKSMGLSRCSSDAC